MKIQQLDEIYSRERNKDDPFERLEVNNESI